MNLFSFEVNQQRRVGMEWEGQLIDLPVAYHASLGVEGPKPGKLRVLPAEMLSFVRLSKLAVDAASDTLAYMKRRPAVPVGEQLVYPFEAVTLLPPLVRPGKILVSGTGVLSKFPSTVVGTEATVLNRRRLPALECSPCLAAVISKPLHPGGDTLIEDAIFGYTLLNDFHAPDLPDPLLRSNLDTFCPLGPSILTSDSFPSDATLQFLIDRKSAAETPAERIRSTLLGAIRGMVEMISLEPGDLVACPYTAEPQRLAPGREIINSLGSSTPLVNRIES